jgi:hypothetical protein
MLIFIIRILFHKRKSVPVELFTEALRHENKGDFETAVLQYQTALAEERKSKFPNNHLLGKINEKLKVLNTVISYQDNFHDENKFMPIPKN